MPMTSPVTRAIYPGESADDESKFVMSFYIGQKYQEDPPVPTEDGVFLQWRPSMKVSSEL